MVKIEDEKEEEEEAPNHGQPPSLDSPVSSISSDHTFHGFSPLRQTPPPTPPSTSTNTTTITTVSPPAPAVANRLVRDIPQALVPKSEADPEPDTREVGVVLLRRARRDKIVKRVGLGLRVFEFFVCLVSFSVMASDKNRGWALDSFDHYIEFRYAMTVNIIGFAYSGLQGLDLLYQLITGKNLTQDRLRCYLDFVMDQILAYLLLSASSSAVTRVEDWISNWGKDKFPAMASASIGVSFLAFATFAFSSLISGYVLSTHRSTL